MYPQKSQSSKKSKVRTIPGKNVVLKISTLNRASGSPSFAKLMSAAGKMIAEDDDEDEDKKEGPFDLHPGVKKDA